ncbi:raffinose/stachyose/melibiose transport system permease protein [Hamadaea flava]|uniref:Carbohydrate ABC transporter permease n=1 Tax=Hamadaea flava TaxID=1742688 RepID=A0ABV8LZC9_9ACTN|nr:carbohydrate ABC transporter permease [Hamadaea flava]MCP2329223.1 raffinose/stachyose/melibiose transport system permease protein [Hamadaea flava]
MVATTLPQPRQRRPFSWGNPLTYVLALAVAAVSFAPVIYVILGGFRTTGQLAADPAGLPDPWIWHTYANVITQSKFWSELFNSTLIAIGTTLGVVVMGVCAAFVLSRYQFRGREALYTYFTVGLLFPAAAGILPLYLLLRDLDLANTYLGVIIPQVAFQLPITIVILRPFLAAFPAELEDAASIDGADRLGFFWRILLPLSRPALVTVAVLAFVASWNSFLLPLLVLQNEGLHTLPLGVQNFSAEHSQDTAGILAFTSLAMMPALLFFSLAERQIVGGLQGAVKG